jgi:hypothetical protein
VTENTYKVYWKEYVEPKRKRMRKVWHKGTFQKRQMARQWCKNNAGPLFLTIVSPDGVEELFK